MTDTPKLNLRQKLIQVYRDIDHVEKAGRNSKQNYNFVRAADVLRAVRNSFAALGIYAETNYDLLGTYDIKTNSGGIMHTATVKATIKLYDTDSDETKTISGLGDGADSGDKGIFKAQTGATKNALRNGTLLPDEADPEADQSVDENTSDKDRFEPEPDFQQARHAAPAPQAKRVETARPTPPSAVALAETFGKPLFEQDGVTNVDGKIADAPTPTEKKSSSGVTAPADVPSETESVPDAAREPGDDTDDELPTEGELTGFRTEFQALCDNLSTKGKLKASKSLPLNRKVLVFMLQIEKASNAKELTKGQWADFFKRAAAITSKDGGLIDLAKLVNKANGIEETK